MIQASGFQIAFLVLAINFLAALVASRASMHLSWTGMSVNHIGQLIVFPVAILLLAAVPALRRACAHELRRRLPHGARLELGLVVLGKAAIPFAVTGAIVLWAFAAGEPSQLGTKLSSADPVRAWQSTLVPAEALRVVLLSWIVGPIIEELVFRGLLYRAWERQWGWIASMLLTSTCFAVYHPTHMAVAFLASVVCVCILRRTGTLRASILVHMAYNVLVSWPFLGQHILTLEGRELARPSAWALELACLVAVAIALPVYVALSRTDARAAPSR